MINLLAIFDKIFTEINLPRGGDVILPPPKGSKFYVRAKGAGRWVYCKYCDKNVMPVILTEIFPDTLIHEMVLCSECGYGLTPSIPVKRIGDWTWELNDKYLEEEEEVE